MKTVIVGGVAGGASTGARLRRLDESAEIVVFNPAEGKLLGAQVLGWDGVDKRIDVPAVAIRAGMTVYDLGAPGAGLRPALRGGQGPG
jgi:hypothetical protein